MYIINIQIYSYIYKFALSVVRLFIHMPFYQALFCCYCFVVNFIAYPVKTGVSVLLQKAATMASARSNINNCQIDEMK